MSYHNNGGSSTNESLQYSANMDMSQPLLEDKQRQLHSILDEGFNELLRSKERSLTKRQEGGQHHQSMSSPITNRSLLSQFQSQSNPYQENNLDTSQLSGTSRIINIENQMVQTFKRPAVIEYSEVKSQKAINDDLSQLQQRIAGLQKKIKQDEVSTKKVLRDGSDTKNRFDRVNSPGITARTTFSFQQSKKSNSPRRKLNLETSTIIDQQPRQRPRPISSDSEVESVKSDTDSIKQASLHLKQLKERLTEINQDGLKKSTSRQSIHSSAQRSVSSRNNSKLRSISNSSRSTSRRRNLQLLPPMELI